MMPRRSFFGMQDVKIHMHRWKMKQRRRLGGHHAAPRRWVMTCWCRLQSYWDLFVFCRVIKNETDTGKENFTAKYKDTPAHSCRKEPVFTHVASITLKVYEKQLLKLGSKPHLFSCIHERSALTAWRTNLGLCLLKSSTVIWHSQESISSLFSL